MSKFERKRSLTPDFRAFSLYKGFEQKIPILGQYAILKWSLILNNTTYIDEIWQKCSTYVYVEKTLVSSVKKHNQVPTGKLWSKSENRVKFGCLPHCHQMFEM